MQISVLDLSVLAYVLLGSTSIGYLLIRTGWPGTRTLEHALKVGSSIAAGIVFSIIVIISSFVLGFSFFPDLPFLYIFFVSLTGSLFVLFVLLLLKQKFFVFRRKVKISFPKKKIVQNQAREEELERIIPEEEFISVRKSLSQQQMEQLKKAVKAELESEKNEQK